jgi:hypothetical protein
VGCGGAISDVDGVPVGAPPDRAQRETPRLLMETGERDIVGSKARLSDAPAALDARVERRLERRSR